MPKIKPRSSATFAYVIFIFLIVSFTFHSFSLFSLLSLASLFFSLSSSSFSLSSFPWFLRVFSFFSLQSRSVQANLPRAKGGFDPLTVTSGRLRMVHVRSGSVRLPRRAAPVWAALGTVTRVESLRMPVHWRAASCN